MAGNPLLDLPVSSNPLLDLLPPKPKAPTATEGFLGKVGDFIVENLGGVSETMRDNARTGRFAQDAAQDQGFFDRAGSLIERGAASFDQGLYNFLGGLGSQKARDAARSISTGTTGRDVAGTTSWEDVNSAGSLGSYVLDAGIESAPAMGALAVPFVGPLSLTASQTGNIASERARNNGRDFIERGDLANAAPAAMLSTALDRFGLKGITNPAGRNVAGRILGAGFREGGTESLQSLTEYGGGTIGTNAGFNLGTALDQMLAGGVAGAGMGAGGRVAMEPVDAFMARRGGAQPQTGQGEPIDSDWEGSLDDMLGGQGDAPWQKYQAPENPLLALPAPQTNTPARKADAAVTGNPIDDFMRRARGAESAGDDSAKNPRSSATGRYQFIDSTWLATYRQEFPNTGETDAQILAKRGDGKLQDRLMRRLTQGNAATLQGAGIPVDTGNLYLAHFAGPAGALALHRNPTASAESILGKSVIKANPFLKGMTGADVIQWAASKMGGGGGTGFTSRAGNALDGMPEIDMPMPQRRDNNAAVLPELAKPDWRLPPDDKSRYIDPATGAPRRFDPDAIISPDNAMINGVQPEQQNDNQPARTGRAPLPDVPETRRGAVSQVVAPRVGPVDTMFELRDMAELVDSSNPAYDKTLQPRDRAGRAASGAQVASIAGTLDPRQLGDSRLASTGAPIIGPDGQVESGNGRIAALRQVYAQFPEQAAAYRQMIADTGLDATGLQFPVLVRRRTTEMTPEQRQAWTRAANERDTMAMSSTEQATADARQLPDSTLSLYRGGPVTAAGNRDFVRAFIERAVAPAERNAMVAPDGSLSVDGARRIRFALLARAYGDSELIGRIAEDTDTNIAAIGKALLEAAPAMAKLRAGIDAGEIPPQYDISANIAEAARMVARSRDTGQSLQGMLAQTDAFADPIAPETEAVLRLFYNDAEFKRARSAVKIADDLIDYARMAETQAANAAQGNDMFGNAPVLDSPATLLQRVRSGDDAAQGDMLAPTPESAYAAPDEQGSRPDRQTAPARPAGVERDGGSRSAVPTLARGQLRALGIAAQLRTEKAAALVGRTASTPRELAEIAQVYRDPRYETFRIFLTKGDTIVHATGVSSRTVDEAPLMPKGMKQDEFIAGILETMRNTGADGFYLLHNHPSGEPDPSRADKEVTRGLARLLPGFRAHVVINSNKYATIDLDAAGRTRSKVSNLNAGEDKLIAASKPHDALGRPILKGGDLAVLGKELQKPGWITVIGTDTKGRTRVVVDYPASTAKKDVRSLMAMARRIKTQSGSSRLFLVGDKDVMDGPTVARALASGIITDAIDNEGNAVFGVRGNKDKMPRPPARFVAQPAYHGSPYTFDKFSLDAIGSGEGAQAFGWGLYFAGRKEIAQHYKQSLRQIDTGAFDRGGIPPSQWRSAEMFARQTDPKFPEQAARDFAAWNNRDDADALTPVFAEAMANQGRLYQVDIPEDNEYLLWDAPLSEQPETVKKALAKVEFDADILARERRANYLAELAFGISNPADVDAAVALAERMIDGPTSERIGERAKENWATLESLAPDVDHNAIHDIADKAGVTGEQIYRALRSQAGMTQYRKQLREEGSELADIKDDQQFASMLLRNAGIAGIKYLDGGSRSAGDGSYNYVLFDDSRIRIDAVEEEAAPFQRDTINVNGKDRPTINSNGQPIARDEAALRNFWNWFGDSKVVDAQGRPLVVYHGTTADFEAFERSAAGRMTKADSAKLGFWFTSDLRTANSYANYGANQGRVQAIIDEANAAERKGDWDTYDAKIQEAEELEARLANPEERAAGQNIIPTYLRIENPSEIDAGGEYYTAIEGGLTAQGVRAKVAQQDGMIIRNMDDAAGLTDVVADHFLVFSPEQIKSINNRGTFDPADPRILMEDTAPFDRGRDPGPSIADGLVDREGLTRDVQKIRDIVSNPVQALKGIMRSGLADNVRALTYSMDSRMRAFAKKYNSPAITELANHFYALAGTGGGPVTETYHEAVEREGFGRAGQALRILEPFIGDRAAMERITRMLRLPGERGRGIRREAEAAARIARLLKDTLDYRREAGEDIGEVTTGYFPRMLDVEKVVQNREAFLRNATELFRIHDAPNPRASAEAWLARTFDQYAGIDGGLDLIDLFHDTRPAGVGRRTTKPRKFGEDADRLLGNFYQNDTGEVLTAYFIGGAKRAEEARRFGGEKMKALFDRIQEDIRASGLDGGDAAGALARMVATNLGRVETPSERVRGTVSFLQTASQLGTLDRALITSLSESMMGFVRGGARYGLPMLIRSIREFARQVRKAPPSEAARMAEALGIAQDALIGEALAARSGFERGQTSRRAQKVQQGFFRANGLEQWTTGTRAAATKMGQEFLYQLATDMASGRGRNAAKYLNELGITDPRGFSRWLLDGGNPTPEQLIGQEVSPNAQAYRTALLRFVNQTIMKPSRAEKPKWASHPVGGMFFSLMSYSYGFKKNVLDRTGRMIARGVKEKDPSLLYPAFGLAALFATHTVINNVIRQAILGGGREDEEEGITFTDWVEALDRAGLFGAASPLINAAFGVRYNRSLTESLAGPVVGRPLDAGTKVFNLATDRNSDNTNTGERAAAAALYDVVLEPALEAYGVTRFKGPAAAAIVWGSGNREGGVIPPDRDIFVEAVAGPKEEQ